MFPISTAQPQTATFSRQGAAGGKVLIVPPEKKPKQPNFVIDLFMRCTRSKTKT